MEQLYELEEKEFSRRQEPATSVFSFAPPVSSITGGPSLSAEERAQRLDSWQRSKHEHLVKGRAHLLGVGLPGVGIRVLSRDRFVAKPRLTVTFHGCEVFDHLDADDADLKKVVEPVVRNRSPYGLGLDRANLHFLPRDYPVAWSNQGEDAEVTLTPESFRPNVPWTSDQDDYVIVVRGPQASSVTVTWELTEDGSTRSTEASSRFQQLTSSMPPTCSALRSFRTIEPGARLLHAALLLQGAQIPGAQPVFCETRPYPSSCLRDRLDIDRRQRASPPPRLLLTFPRSLPRSLRQAGQAVGDGTSGLDHRPGQSPRWVKPTLKCLNAPCAAARGRDTLLWLVSPAAAKTLKTLRLAGPVVDFASVRV